MDIIELVGRICRVSEEQEAYEIQGIKQDEQGKKFIILKSITDGEEIDCEEETFSYLFKVDAD